MKTVSALIFIFLCFQLDLYENPCQWLSEVENTKEIAIKLDLIKENFKDTKGLKSSYDKEKTCDVVVVININGQHLIITDIYFKSPEKVVEIIRPNEIDQIGVIGEKGAKVLYAAQGVIVIESTSKALEERIYSIRFD